MTGKRIRDVRQNGRGGCLLVTSVRVEYFRPVSCISESCEETDWGGELGRYVNLNWVQEVGDFDVSGGGGGWGGGGVGEALG